MFLRCLCYCKPYGRQHKYKGDRRNKSVRYNSEFNNTGRWTALWRWIYWSGNCANLVCRLDTGYLPLLNWWYKHRMVEKMWYKQANWIMQMNHAWSTASQKKFLKSAKPRIIFFEILPFLCKSFIVVIYLFFYFYTLFSFNLVDNLVNIWMNTKKIVLID